MSREVAENRYSIRSCSRTRFVVLSVNLLKKDYLWSGARGCHIGNHPALIQHAGANNRM